MDNIIVNFHVGKYGVMPVRAHDSDAGLDLINPKRFLDPNSDNYVNELIIYPNGYTTLYYDIRMEPLSPRTFGLLVIRSGKGELAELHNGIGIIDNEYRGSLMAKLRSKTGEPIILKPGERWCQLILLEQPKYVIREVPYLGPTNRGEGGFGSTGY